MDGEARVATTTDFTSSELPRSVGGADLQTTWNFSPADSCPPETQASPDDRTRSCAALRSYLSRLEALQFDDGPLVAFPGSYDQLVEHLFFEHRRGYASLKDWSGPRRFRDLPIAAFHADVVPDAETAEGLRVIDRLDVALRRATLEQYIFQHETNPHQAARQKEARRAQHQKLLERSLERERNRIVRQERLRKALALDDDSEETRIEVARLRSLCSEEQTRLVEALMATPDDELSENPFECDVAFPEAVSSYGNCALSCETSAGSALERGDLGENTSSSDSRARTLPDVAASRQSSHHQSLKPDYLRAQRQERETQRRLRQIDATLLQMRKRDPWATSLTAGALQDVIAESRSELLNNDIALLRFTHDTVLEAVKAPPLLA